MNLFNNFKKIVKNILTGRFSFLLIYPIIFFFSLYKGIRYFFHKKNLKINLEFKDKFNQDELGVDLSKTHINFRKNSQKLSLVIRIAEINKEIKIVCDKYKIDFNRLDYNYLTKIQNTKISEKIIISSLYFWIFKLLFRYPSTGKIIFSSFKGLTIKKFNNVEKNDDDKIANYLSLNFIIKNLSQINLNSDKIKVLLEKYISKYDDKYSLSLAQHYSEFSLCNADFLYKISKLNNDKFSKSTNLNQPILGSSLYAFGHMLSFIDYHYRINSKDINIVISPYWVANSCLAYYLKYKYKNCIINHDYFIQVAQKDNFGKDTRTDLFEYKNSIYNLTFREFEKSEIVSASLDIDILNQVIKDKIFKKINTDDKYICFFNRDTSFKKENFKFNANDQDRACDATIFKPVLEFFINKGLKIVIMGNPGQQSIDMNNKNIIDYANSEYKNDYNDIILSKNCEFFVNGGASSNEFLPPLFRKFGLNLERPFNRKPKFHDLAYYLIRPMYKNDKLIKFEDYYNNELFINEDFNMLKKMGYKLKHSSKENLIMAAENFWEAFNGRKNLFTKKKIKKGNILNYYNLLDF